MKKPFASLAWPLVLLLAAAGCENASNAPSGPVADATIDMTYVEWGNYIIHFNAFTTDQLSPEVASKYGISRSKSRAMLNVTVLQKQPDGMNKAVKAKITAQTTSLASQIKDLTLREIVEGDGEAIYYVGDTPVAKDESLVFDVQVTPEGETQSHRLRFTRHFTY
jgi:hypothetical protein